MKKFRTIFLLLLGFATIVSFAQTIKPTEKLKRADCFFGIHFDLHASEDIKTNQNISAAR
jgi:hypothetical protein